MKQLDTMYAYYGKAHGRKCGSCANIMVNTRNTADYKCARYGISQDKSSSWGADWLACGKFDVPLRFGEKPLLDWAIKERERDLPLDGQITIGDLGV